MLHLFLADGLDDTVMVTIVIAQSATGRCQCQQLTVFVVAEKGTDTFAPPFSCQTDATHEDATGTQNTCQLFLWRYDVVFLQVVVLDLQGIKQLSECRLACLWNSAFLAQESQSLSPAVQSFCKETLLQLPAFVDLFNIDGHVYSLLIKSLYSPSCSISCS